MRTEASSSTTRIRDVWVSATMSPRSDLYYRQINLKNCAMAYAAAHHQLAGMILNDAFDDPEAQAGAFFPFSSNERFKDCPNHLWWDAGAAIGDDDTHPATEIIAPG